MSLLLFAASAFCASPSVLVTVSDFTLDYSAPNRVVRLNPTAATGGTARRGLSDSSGQVTFASVTPGLWTLTIESIGVPALSLRVPSSSATLSASNLVVSAWTPPTPATASSAANNLRAWSLLVTDPLALPGDISLDGKTNRIGDNGTAITYNGTAAGGGSATPWTTNEDAAGFALTNLSQTIWNDGAEICRIQGGGGARQFFVESADGALVNDPSTAKLALIISATSASLSLHQFNSDGVSAGIQFYTSTTGTNRFPAFELFDGSSYLALLDPTGQDGDDNYIFDATVPASRILSVRTNGTTVFSVAASGLASSVAGFASTDTTAAVNIAATGWTNTFGKNAVVYYDGISITAKVYNNAGIAIYTNATALGGGSILLQPSGKVILSGTSVVGRAAPF